MKYKKEIMKLLLSLLLFVPGAYGQNVGIGTTTPARPLHIAGSAELLRIQGNFPWIGFMNNTDPTYGGFLYYPDTSLVLGSRSGTNLPLIIAPNNIGLLYATATQRIGIGSSSPTEKLDVNGSINVTGTIKTNGTDGLPNQVLMKNNSGNLAWGDICEYKNFAVFNYFPSPQNWTIPAGVTKVMVEIWGGGGGGSTAGGGGGGGYGRTIFNVSTGSIIVIVGNGGTPGTNGQNSSVEYSYFTITAGGGEGADGTTPGNGGFNGTSSATVSPCYGLQGEDGGRKEERYEQRSSTGFVRTIIGGKGGRAAMTDHTSGGGGFRQEDAATTTLIYIINAGSGNLPGGGGGGHVGTGAGGAPGMVVIYY